MKFLPAMKINEFKMSLLACNFCTLKQLIEGIYEFKRKYYKKFKTTEGNQIVLDIELKETLLMKEIERRGIDIASSDFVAWIDKIKNRADKIMVVKK